MTRSMLLALSAVMLLLLGACGGGEDEEAAPLPTPIPTLAGAVADQDTTGEEAVEEPAEVEPVAEVPTEDDAAAEDTTAEDTTAEDTAAEDTDAVDENTAQDDSSTATAGGPRRGQAMGNGGMMGGGMGNSMRQYHMIAVPGEYAGLTSPIPVDAESIERGKAHFTQFCASCHGNEGLGDGPAAVGLDPAPPIIAQTSLMLGDDFLFWRISEGGAFDPFNSAMPSWKAVLDEEARWDVINYARSLSHMEVMGGMGQGGMGNGPMREEMQAAMHGEMIAAGIDQGLINAAEGEVFIVVHDSLDAYRESLGSGAGNMEENLDEWLAVLVEEGQLSQTDANAFVDVHDRLDAAGLMQ